MLEERSPTDEPVVLVTCEGALARADGARLRDLLLVQLRHGRCHLLLDLAGVDLLDDVGAATLVDVQRRARAARCTFRVVAPSAQVMERLRLTGIHRVLAVHETLESALAAL